MSMTQGGEWAVGGKLSQSFSQALLVEGADELLWSAAGVTTAIITTSLRMREVN